MKTIYILCAIIITACFCSPSAYAGGQGCNMKARLQLIVKANVGSNYPHKSSRAVIRYHDMGDCPFSLGWGDRHINVWFTDTFYAPSFGFNQGQVIYFNGGHPSAAIYYDNPSIIGESGIHWERLSNWGHMGDQNCLVNIFTDPGGHNFFLKFDRRFVLQMDMDISVWNHNAPDWSGCVPLI